MFSRRSFGVLLTAALCLILGTAAFAQDAGGVAGPQIRLDLPGGNSPGELSVPLQLLILLTILSVAPAILMMMTSFTRIVIVLSLTRHALGTQQVPPNQVLMGLALALTFFSMQPTLAEVNDAALQPYLNKKLPFEQALERGTQPVRHFMLQQTREKDLALFVELGHISRPSRAGDVPTFILIPAFIVSEIQTAFVIGFVIFLPFLVIDIVVSMVLMSLGMMMLPPAMVSLPFKILLFVMVDGWHLLTRALMLSFG